MNKKNKTAPRISAYANKILNRVCILENPYFRQLQNGTMSLEQFCRTQEEFHFAVTFFSRPMAVLVARIPHPKDRLNVLHNILEEHGDFDENDFHSITFHRFLKSIGSKIDDFDQCMLSPQMRTFNNTLIGTCTFDELETGIACMGIIERAFADISGFIAHTVVDREWIKKDELCHYNMHAELDIQHAEEFFAVIEPLWNDKKKQYFILQGLELGVYIFDRLYKDLLTLYP